MKIFKCNICGNVVELLEEGGGQLVCCGEEMKLINAHTEDEGFEKHVPVITVEGNNVNVKVGSIAHPMMENHFITKIFVIYNNKVLRKNLSYTDVPEANFVLDEEYNSFEVYEYCNIHGLWKSTYTK